MRRWFDPRCRINFRSMHEIEPTQHREEFGYLLICSVNFDLESNTLRDSKFYLFIFCCLHCALGCGQKKYVSVAVQPTPVRVPSQRRLARLSRQSRLLSNGEVIMR